jgi:hypothetical protein
MASSYVNGLLPQLLADAIMLTVNKPFAWQVSDCLLNRSRVCSGAVCCWQVLFSPPKCDSRRCSTVHVAQSLAQTSQLKPIGTAAPHLSCNYSPSAALMLPFACSSHCLAAALLQFTNVTRLELTVRGWHDVATGAPQLLLQLSTALPKVQEVLLLDRSHEDIYEPLHTPTAGVRAGCCVSCIKVPRGACCNAALLPYSCCPCMGATMCSTSVNSA